MTSLASADRQAKEACMTRVVTRFKSSICRVGLIFFLVGCANSGHHFFDSAMNDRNRAPASLGVPDSFDQEIMVIDSMHNQAEADYLFLKSEMESNVGRNTETIGLLRSALIYDPEAVTIMQRLAVEYYKNSKVSEAIEWAEKAKALSPDRRDLNLLLAGLYTTTKNYTKAEALYKQLIKKDDEDTEARLYLGAVYTEQKNYSKAIEVFLNLSRQPDYSSKHLVHYYLARVYSEQNKFNYTKIESELKKSISLKSDFFEAVNMLGRVIEKKSGQDQAYAFYARHQQQFGPNLNLAGMLSQYYISKNAFDKAYEQLEILDESSDDSIQVKLKMALILIEKKAYDRAIPKLHEILLMAPESDKVRFYLAAVYEEKKDFKNSFAQYMLVDKASSYFEESRLHAAYLAKLMNRVDEGVAILNVVIGSGAENPQSYFLMSQLFEDKNDLQSAINILHKAQAKFSKNSQVYYFLGVLQDKMNLKDAMLENMKKVIELEPDHAQALNYLAYTWAESGKNLDLAESYARKAVAKEKEDAFILDTLGWVLFKKGKYQDAIDILDKAQAMQPQASIISEHLGDIYTKINMHERARQLFIKAVEIESDVDRQKQIKSKLTQVENRLKDLREPSSTATDLNKSKSP